MYPRVSCSGLNIWTVGHSTHPLEVFLKLLTTHHVEAIVDVRRFPFSPRFPWLGQDMLPQDLSLANLGYHHLAQLGGRRPPLPNSVNTAWRNSSFQGYADYMGTTEFEEGMEQLLQRARAQRVAIMCSEAVWWRCHRSLIADFLTASEASVFHVLSTAAPQPHPYTAPARLLAGHLTYAAGEGVAARKGKSQPDSSGDEGVEPAADQVLPD